jgi:hypothetical protein
MAEEGAAGCGREHKIPYAAQASPAAEIRARGWLFARGWKRGGGKAQLRKAFPNSSETGFYGTVRLADWPATNRLG